MFPLNKAQIFFVAVFCALVAVVCFILSLILPHTVIFSFKFYHWRVVFIGCFGTYAFAFLLRHFITKEKWEWPF